MYMCSLNTRKKESKVWGKRYVYEREDGDLDGFSAAVKGL
jgi:hypothetical protein